MYDFLDRAPVDEGLNYPIVPCAKDNKYNKTGSLKKYGFMGTKTWEETQEDFFYQFNSLFFLFINM